MPMHRALAIALVVAMTGLAGCVDSAQDASAPKPEDIGGAGWQIRGSDFYWSYHPSRDSYTETKDWNNVYGSAGLEVGASLSSGHVRVLLQDASGAAVWSQEFGVGSHGGVFHAGAGKPGTWTFLLDRANATGSFDLHAWIVKP